MVRVINRFTGKICEAEFVDGEWKVKDADSSWQSTGTSETGPV